MPVPENISTQTAPPDTEWDSPDLEDFTDSSWEDLSEDEKRAITQHFAWRPSDNMDEINFTDLKLPHHRPADGFVVKNGVDAAVAALEGARGGVEGIPDDEESSVRAHLEEHQAQYEENETNVFDVDTSHKGNPSERKSIVFDSFQIGTQTKQVDGEDMEVATFEGVANVMEHEDLGGDIVHSGAFSKTLKDKNGKVPFVTDHTYKVSNYAGVARLEEQGNRLKANVEVLLTNNPAGKEFYTKAKFANSHNDPFGLSIGYDIPEGKSEIKDGTRHIYEVKLWEVSGVLFPMNELSRAVGFKDFHKYSRTDLANAKQIIQSLLNKQPPQGTDDDEADLIKQLDKLKPENYE